MREIECRLLIITDTYVGYPGGSEKHLYNFLSSISDAFEVDVIQMTPREKTQLPDGPMCENEHVVLHSYPLSNIRSMASLEVLAAMRDIIISRDIEVVVSYHEKADIFNYLVSRLPGVNVKTVSSKRDMGFKLTAKLKRLMQFITPKLVNITSPCHSIAELMVDEFKTSPSSTHVIPNGVDLSAYNSLSGNKKQLMKQQLGLPAGYRVICSVGSLIQIKGFNYLLEAFKRFSDQTTEQWVLLLIGNGDLEGELKAQAQLLGIADRVIFTGLQDNVNQWLSVSDLMASATLSEGLSNAMVEATAAGLPIVATKVGGNAEIVEHGHNGFLVESEDAFSLAKAIQRISCNEDLHRYMAKNARLKAESSFSNASMVMQLESLYLNLAGRLRHE